MMDDRTIETLHDYVDGLLDEAERPEFEARIAKDADLRAELESVRALRASVNGLPRRMEPERDLWPEIASRLDEPAARAIQFGQYGRRTRIPIAGQLVAAAAVIIVALSAPYLLAPRSTSDPTPAAVPVAAVDPEFERVAGQYLAAREELLALLEERKADIAPETFAVVEENLSVIAAAVTEIETALAEQPENENVERMLYAAYRSEVNLLRQAVQLSDAPAASNEGDEEKGDNDAG
jgi:hypothetical protein